MKCEKCGDSWANTMGVARVISAFLCGPCSQEITRLTYKRAFDIDGMHAEVQALQAMMMGGAGVMHEHRKVVKELTRLRTELATEILAWLETKAESVTVEPEPEFRAERL